MIEHAVPRNSLFPSDLPATPPGYFDVGLNKRRWPAKHCPGGHAMNSVFKALADPTRREILRLLTRGELTAGTLAEQFDMTRPTVSHHFHVLKEADLIRSRREGQQIYYALNTTVVQDVLTWAMDLLKIEGGPAAAADGARPETEGGDR